MTGHVIPQRVERRQETGAGRNTGNKTFAGATGMPPSEDAASMEATKHLSSCPQDDNTRSEEGRASRT